MSSCLQPWRGLPDVGRTNINSISMNWYCQVAGSHQSVHVIYISDTKSYMCIYVFRYFSNFFQLFKICYQIGLFPDLIIYSTVLLYIMI